MKHLTRALIFGLVVLFIFGGCAKQPAQEIDDAKKAIESLSKAGAANYVRDEFKRLNDDITIALNEVKIQEGKIFKNYNKPKEILGKVKSDAEELSGVLEKVKEARKAIESLVRSGAINYIREDFRKLNGDLASTLNEVKTQGNKGYGKAKEILTKVKDNAEAIKGTLVQKQEEVKNSAATVQHEAKTAIDEAKALLAKAPKGKGATPEIEALKANLKRLEDSLLEVQRTADMGDYFNANEKAKNIKEIALSLTAQCKKALESAKTKTIQKPKKSS
jgi:hypothetical protein